MWYIVCSILVFALGFGVSHAQERGIGVSPAEIEISGQVDWPYTVPVVVQNLSSAAEPFQIAFAKEGNVEASAVPGRFQLKPQERKRVLLTFENPGKEISGFVLVATTGAGEGFPARAGIKIPFSISGEPDTKKFFAGVGEIAGGFPYLFGAGMMLVTFVLLWHLAGIVQSWIFNSNKQ